MKKYQPIPNTACLVSACRKLGIRYTFYDIHHNLVGVFLDREYFFANASTPFNEEVVGKICKDKEFTYRIAHSKVEMPRTIGFIDPECNPDYRSYVKLATHEDIIKKIERNFSYPMIIKMNSGSRGVNVFRCNTKSDTADALTKIYDKSSQHYDYIALAQEYVPISREFRVVVFQGKLVLVYEKYFSHAIYKGNISPLHQDNSKAIFISDQITLERLSDFIKPLFKKIAIGFAGLDIVIDTENKMHLLEINSKPGFEYFVRDNGTSKLIEMYTQMLIFLRKG